MIGEITAELAAQINRWAAHRYPNDEGKRLAWVEGYSVAHIHSQMVVAEMAAEDAEKAARPA